MKHDDTPFYFQSEKLHSFELNTQIWVAQVVTGAAVIDSRMDHKEAPYLRLLIEFYENNPVIREKIQIIMDSSIPMSLPQLPQTSDFPDDVFQCILGIFSCDTDLHISEVIYIKNSADLLGIDPPLRKKWIRRMILQRRMEYFNGLLHSTSDPQKHWLASVILKMIYADGRIDKFEVPYLNNVYELLEGKPDLLELVKSDSRNLSFDKLPKVSFDDKEVNKKILRFLLEIMVEDSDIDQSEYSFSIEVARQLDISYEEMKETLEAVATFRSIFV